MAGPVFVLDVGIILRALVDIVDDEADRRSSRDLRAALVGKHARQDAHRVRLLPLRGEARLTGATLVEKWLDIGLAERDARRHAVDHAADRWPMALAEG